MGEQRAELRTGRRVCKALRAFICTEEEGSTEKQEQRVGGIRTESH